LRGNHFRIGEQLFSAGELKFQSNNASNNAQQNGTQENQSSLSRLRTLIREQLLTQLALCPESVIIIDEFELFHRRTVTVFQEFLDATYPVITYNSKSWQIQGGLTPWTNDQ
jgi:thymidine kinase